MGKLNVARGEPVSLFVDGRSYRLAAIPSPAGIEGVAGLGYGLPRSPMLTFPAWGKVEKARP
jgi:hypothetical protein